MQDAIPFGVPAVGRPEPFPKIGEYARHATPRGRRSVRHNRARLEGIMSMTAVAGDLAMILLGFVLAFWLRYQSGILFEVDAGKPAPVISDYWKLILFGSAVVFCGLLSKVSYR
jgi:hypothetical protein